MRQTKDSGIEWIGDIPEDWTTTNLKNLFDLYLGSTPKSDDSDNWDGDITWICPSDFKTEDKYVYSGRRNLSQKGYDSCSTTLVEKGSLIFTKRAPVGTIGIAETSLCPGTGCIACTPKQGVNSPFYYYVLSICTDEFNSYSAGTTFMEISLTKFSEFKVMVPPTADQNKIAGCLDRITSRFTSLITNLNNQIDKLKDYKKALITKCVTKGLDPNVPLKDSGIDWIGEIPENWTIERIKNVCEIFGRIGFRGYTSDDLVGEGQGPITLSPSNFDDMKMNYSKCSYLTWDKYNESPEIQIHNGDILYVKTGSSFGKSCMVNGLPLEATINPQMIVMKNVIINPKYFVYFLQSSVIRFQSDIAVIGGTIPTISQEKIYNYHIAVPPESEQNKISLYLDKKCSEIDSLISSKQQQIDKLNEYQKSLIYEYVTGKKEVV